MATAVRQMNVGSWRAVASITLILLSGLSYGQVHIIADTISFNCKEVYRTNKEVFILTSPEDVDDLSVFRDNPDCLPFEGIDFKKTAVVGFKYQGSNCDRMIHWSRILENGGQYLIQFATWPNHVCRDLRIRIAWFIIEKPPGEVHVRFERVSHREHID